MSEQQSIRPKIRVTPSQTDITVEITTAIGMLTSVIIMALYWQRLPATIPTHFGFNGQPDAWGSKSTIFLLPAISIGMYLLLTIVSRFPHIFNYPMKITQENAERQYRLAVSMMRWLKLELAWMFTYLTWSTILVALGKAHGLGSGFAIITLIAMFGTIAIYTAFAFRTR
jgi:uncharacterized membrane protein